MELDFKVEVTKLAKLIHKQYVENTYMFTSMEHSLKGNVTLKNNAKGHLVIFKKGTVNGRTFIRLIELYNPTLIKLLGFDILVLVDEIIRKNNIDTKCKIYICNELYNCINHNNISFKNKLRKKDTFDVLIKYLNIYGGKVNSIVNLEEHIYTSEDVHMATGYDDMDWTINSTKYTLVFIKPLPHNSKIVANPKNPIYDPVILDDKLNIVYNSKLNDSIAYLSKKYKLPLYIRCLVPITALNDVRLSASISLDKLELSKRTFSKKDFSSRSDLSILRPYWLLNENSYSRSYLKNKLNKE